MKWAKHGKEHRAKRPAEIKYYVISLGNRMKNVVNICKTVNADIINAIDGIDERGIDKSIKKHGIRYVNLLKKTGDLGAYLSHLEALYTIITKRDGISVILEDDIKLDKDHRRNLQTMLNEIAGKKWDILMLSILPQFGTWPRIPITNNVCHYYGSLGTAAYCVNGSTSAQKVYDILRIKFESVIDVAIKTNHKKINIFSAKNPIMNGDIQSGVSFGPPNKYQRKLADYYVGKIWI